MHPRPRPRLPPLRRLLSPLLRLRRLRSLLPKVRLSPSLSAIWTTADKFAETKEDEINYTDDEDDKPAKPDAAAASAATETAEAPAPAADAPAAETEEAPAAAAEPAVDAPPPTNFAIGLASTAADEEAKKRAERAKRFGIEEDDDAKKRADRAARFGLDEKELASGLDSALPERPLKRGRGRGGEEAAAASGRPNKRQSQDRRGGGAAGRRRGGGRDNNRAPARTEGAAKKGSGILDDPAERAKAEKRAARFAS